MNHVKFINPYAYHLAFEIMGIAQGLFSRDEDKIDYPQLPPEIRLRKYAELAPKLQSVLLVSKEESKIPLDAQINWINIENASLKVAGCKTIQEAIMFIKNNKSLNTVNLLEFKKKNDFTWSDLFFNFFETVEFKYLTGKDLENIRGCLWIKKLFISSNSITDKGLNFLSKLPLQSLDIRGGVDLTDNGFQYLKNMPLQEIDFSGCDQLTDNALPYLMEMPLQSVVFFGCNNITDEALEKLCKHYDSRG